MRRFAAHVLRGSNDCGPGPGESGWGRVAPHNRAGGRLVGRSLRGANSPLIAGGSNRG